MNKRMASSIGIALFLLAGCGAPGLRLASSAEDIVGRWHSTNSRGEVRFNEDGTLLVLVTPTSPSVGEFRFEGTRLFYKNVCPGSVGVLEGAETGIYEVELLENGNLKFRVIEDECPGRAGYLEGPLLEREWEPVP